MESYQSDKGRQAGFASINSAREHRSAAPPRQLFSNQQKDQGVTTLYPDKNMTDSTDTITKSEIKMMQVRITEIPVPWHFKV